jgi:hypothetical protein
VPQDGWDGGVCGGEWVRAAEHDGEFDDSVLRDCVLRRGGTRVEDGSEDPGVLRVVVSWRARDKIAEPGRVNGSSRCGWEDEVHDSH